MKKHLQRLLALVLALCCIAGPVCPAAAAGEAHRSGPIQVPVLPVSGVDIMGSFFRQDAQVFVELGTLKMMDLHVDVCLSDSDDAVWVYRKMYPGNTLIPNPDIQSIEFGMDELLVNEYGIFVPFSAAMEALGLYPVVDHSRKQLAIMNAGKVRQLGWILHDVYTDPCYNMRYWKDSANYRQDVKWAQIVRDLRELDLISVILFEYVSDMEYREAFARIIKPQNKQDMDLSANTDKTEILMDILFSTAENVAKSFIPEVNTDHLKSMEDTCGEVYDRMKTHIAAHNDWSEEKTFKLAAYLHALREVEESTIRALKAIEPETCGISERMSHALNEVLHTYGNGTALWKQALNHVNSTLKHQSLDSLDDLIKNTIPNGYLFAIGNSLTEYYLDTGSQVSSTAQASRYLDIQTCCEQVFEKTWPKYYTAAPEKRGEYLQLLYDVTKLYLTAGINAQEAISHVDGFRSATHYAIEKMQQEQQRIAEFSQADIDAYAYYAQAETWIHSLEQSPAAPEDLYIPVPFTVDTLPDTHTFVTVTWEPEINDTWVDMTANIMGTMDDGTPFPGPGSDGGYVRNFEPMAFYSKYGKWIDLDIFRKDADLEVVVEYDDDMSFGAPSYAEANVNIHVYNPMGTLAIIAANPDQSPFSGSPYMRDAEHFHYYGNTWPPFFLFRLDHGEFRKLPDDIQPKQQNTADKESGNRPEEHFTLDGHLQSSELYNADGYKLESCWYDHGECTAYTRWTYNENMHLTEICYTNAFDPDEVQMIFENTYANGKLQKVSLYNTFGTPLGEGPTAADAADAVGMRMYVEESLPK